jgi:hypothetical protein
MRVTRSRTGSLPDKVNRDVKVEPLRSKKLSKSKKPSKKRKRKALPRVSIVCVAEAAAAAAAPAPPRRQPAAKKTKKSTKQSTKAAAQDAKRRAREAKAAAKALAKASKLRAKAAKAAAKALAKETKKAQKALVLAEKKARKPVRIIKVAGTSFRSADVVRCITSAGEVYAENRLMNAHVVQLRPEPKNKYDRNAVAIVVSGFHIGYVPKSQNRSINRKASYVVWGLRYVQFLGQFAASIAEMPPAYGGKTASMKSGG